MNHRVTNLVDELNLQWVQAVLRALIIPFDPAVARVEADVWEEWASNAPPDSTEQLVLTTAARLARTEQTSEARIPPALDSMSGDILANPTGPAMLAAYGVLEGYVQARQTILLGPNDVPVWLSESQEIETNTSRAAGRASAHRAVLLSAIEHHAANVPVWRWLARWYGSLSLAQGHTIEDLNTFGWGQVAFSLSIRISAAANPFVREAWSVIDRMAAASVCYTKRSADFAIFTLMSLRGTGDAEPVRAPLPAPRGVMHSIPLTLGEIWDATKLFRSPDRAPEDVFTSPAKFHAYELEVRAPDPTWAHMTSGRKALKEIQPDVPGKEKERHLHSRVTTKRRVHEARESRFSVMAILDDPPRFGSPFLGEIAVRDEDRATTRLLKSLPPL